LHTLATLNLAAMPDPIVTIVTAAIEHAPSTAVIASIYGVAKPFLAKILGPAADEVGEIGRDYIKGFRAKNIEARLNGADKLLNDAGIDPQPVPPKVLVPLLESASLEDNPLLSEHWEGLLANAANPKSRAKVDGNLVDILKQLNYSQAIILLVIGVMLEKGGDNRSNQEKASIFLSTPAVMEELRMLHEGQPDQGFDISDDDFYISLDNLVRLRLCTVNGMDPLDAALSEQGKLREAMKNLQMFLAPGRENISITYLGLTFLAACEAPKRGPLLSAE
jgi:hypothetical protein